MLGLKYHKCQEVRKECSGVGKGPVATGGQRGDWRGLKNPDPIQGPC